MNILALGGCGGIGQYAVKTLLAQQWCGHIIIADRHAKRAQDFAGSLGPSVSCKIVDIEDPVSLSHAMEGINIVMNTTGPFYLFGKKILEACIKSRCHYIDICDDWEPTLEMLDLHEAAEAAGITAILGLGATPGISNLLGVKAIAALDTATDLYTCWDIEYAQPAKDAPKPSAATIHGLHQLTQPITVLENGTFKSMPPFQARLISYRGSGNLKAYTIGHPESVTFPHYFSSLTDCHNIFTINKFNNFFLKGITAAIKKHFIGLHKAAYWAENLEALLTDKAEIEDWKQTAEKIERKKILPPLFALAKGIKDGKPETVACTVRSAPPGGMAGATGIPLAIGVHLLASGTIQKKGVFAPEGIIDPDLFFDLLAPLCSPPLITGMELVAMHCEN